MSNTRCVNCEEPTDDSLERARTSVNAIRAQASSILDDIGDPS